MKKSKLKKKIMQSNKALQSFIKTTIKNFQSMKKKFKKIWLKMFAALFLATAATSCNVTRTVTTKSEYFQNGDTATTIVTKTVESYDATKKGM